LRLELTSDTPELFWSEASLYPLYEAIREYLEIGPRAQVLNDRLSVAGDLVSFDYFVIDVELTSSWKSYMNTSKNGARTESHGSSSG